MSNADSHDAREDLTEPRVSLSQLLNASDATAGDEAADAPGQAPVSDGANTGMGGVDDPPPVTFTLGEGDGVCWLCGCTFEEPCAPVGRAHVACVRSDTH